MRGLFANSSLALESLQFQSGQFFRELTIVFEQMQKVPDKDLPEHQLFEQIGDVIKKHTNLTVTPHVDQYGPAIILPKLDRNHPLVATYFRDNHFSSDSLNEIKKAGGQAHGSVSLKTGRVDGIFAELNSTLLMSVQNIKHHGFTAEELAAVTLHEVGHFFVFCEMINRTMTTNYVLNAMARALDGSEGLEKRETVLVTVKEALRLKDLDAKTLAKSNDPRVVETVVITSVLRETFSELGSNYYDNYGFEYLSDEYATRQGAGRHLVTALDKMHREDGDSAYWSTPVYLIWEAVKLALLFFPLTFKLGLGLFVDSNRGMVHEPIEARIRRVRNQLVEAMKVKKLPPERYALLKEDLAACDRLIAQVTDRRTFFEAILMVVIPAYRREWNQLVLQKQLEDLALNDLFVKAHDLKQLA